MPTLSVLRKYISTGERNLGTSAMHTSQLPHSLCPEATLEQRLRPWPTHESRNVDLQAR